MTLALLLLACSNQQEATEAARDEVIDAMEAHWDDAQSMRDAAIAGDVDAYRKAAAALYDRMPLEGLPEAVSPLGKLLEDATNHARHAADTEEMGTTLGTVVAACGTCHDAANVTPGIEPTLPPPEEAEAPLEMLWHQLAALELWAAIVRHDADGWSKGVGMVEKGVYRVDDGTAKGAAQDEIEARVQAIAQKAHGAADTAARAEAFGRLIGTCSACHDLKESAAEEGGGTEEKGPKERKGKKGKRK
jgi:hypothetical protein